MDSGGKRWSKRNYLNGYTSYGSASQLHKQSTTFKRLEEEISKHVRKFSLEIDLELSEPLSMSNCWINRMSKGSYHGLHIHPLSVISGTYYVCMPEGATGLRFEDPRMSLYMGAPGRSERCKMKNKIQYMTKLGAGGLVLFESWLRHEVPVQSVEEDRVSVSFNYGL